MTHEDAARTEAVDRYLLGELTPLEAAEFEEHYFDCAECAGEVRLGAMFRANARAVFSSEAGRVPSHRPAILVWMDGLLGWRRPAFVLGAAFASLLVVVAVWQFRENARLRAPQAYPAFFLHGATRGDEQLLEAPRSSRFLGIGLDLPPDRKFPQYRCTVVAAAGGKEFSVDAPAPGNGASLNLLVPVSGLAPGRYTFVLKGLEAGSATELSRYSFTLAFH